MHKLTAAWKPVLVSLMAGLIAACAGEQPVPQTPDDSGRTRITRQPDDQRPRRRPSANGGEQIAELAMSLVGSPYSYGGEDPSGFDCSGLVFYSFAQTGVAVPRTSMQQYRAARKIGLDDAEAGDIVFFQDQVQLSHVGVYVGDDMFVHAPASGRRVSLASLSAPYYQRHLVAVGRLHEF